ncbi:hypothetical protein ABZP36_000785 [Zizania latifolia]
MDIDKATAVPSSGVSLGVREGGVGARRACNARISVRPPPIGMDLGMDTAVFLELVRNFVAKEKRRKMQRLARLVRLRARNAWMRARRRAAAGATAPIPAESAAATAPPLRLLDEEGPPPAAAAADQHDPHEAGETEPAPMEDGGVPASSATRRASFGSNHSRL